MRTQNHFTLLGGLLGGFGLLASGCIDALEDYYYPLTDPKLATTTTGTGGGGGSGGTGGGGNSGGGGSPVNCDPKADPMTAVDASCGVFVSATGADSDKGTREKPVKSFNQALILAQANGAKKTIYACAEEFAGKVEMPGGIAVYGGLDCSATPRSWKYVGDKSKTTITADAEVIPLVLAGGSGVVKLEDLHILAKAAENPGGSSIAVAVDQVIAEIGGCVFEAGNAKEGTPGQNYPSAAQGGNVGLKGGDACTANTVNGGDPVSSSCGDPDSVSGNGGSGFSVSGGAGSPGLPDGSMNGGAGEGAMACTPGMKGDDGVPGPPGLGATGLGSFSKAGFLGIVGEPGNTGLPAQGGGGGGGAKGGTGAGKCPAGMAGGAAGGSGGSGGCGGLGGKGGSPGGSSIALLSLDATLTFTATTLITGAGGKGGDGGQGQAGGDSGSGGSGGAVGMNASLLPGCSGGPGGFGGKGGQGGGGTGGHSIGIAYTKIAPPKDGWTAMTGTFGPGGMGGDAAGNGAPGVKADMQVFQ